MSNFQAYSEYYDLLYQDKNYDAEVQYVHALIQKHTSKTGSILEIGSGTGKHAKLLAKHGYTVTGVERSADMVQIANQQKTENVTFLVGDLNETNLDEQFDVSISLFHVVSYMTDNDTLLATFRKVAGYLKPGGVFIFDVWYSPAVNHQVPETRIKRLKNDRVSVTRLAEPVIHYRENIVDVNYEVLIQYHKTNELARVTEKHPMRHFGEPEIDLLAKASGFNVIATEEFLSGRIPGNDTWGVCFVLQKK